MPLFKSYTKSTVGSPIRQSITQISSLSKPASAPIPDELAYSSDEERNMEKLITKTVMRNQAKRRKQFELTHGDGKSIIKLDHPTPESIAESLKPRIKLVPFIALQETEEVASPAKSRKSIKTAKFKDQEKLNSIEEDLEESKDEIDDHTRKVA